MVEQTKPGRNQPCPCGSGKKYKKCCGSGQKTARINMKKVLACLVLKLGGAVEIPMEIIEKTPDGPILDMEATPDVLTLALNVPDMPESVIWQPEKDIVVP